MHLHRFDDSVVRLFTLRDESPNAANKHLEIAVPTCSYRMGVNNIGFGMAVLGEYCTDLSMNQTETANVDEWNNSCIFSKNTQTVCTRNVLKFQMECIAVFVSIVGEKQNFEYLFLRGSPPISVHFQQLGCYQLAQQLLRVARLLGRW